MGDRDPLRRRPAELVTAILATVYEADDPVPWLEVIYSDLSNRWPSKTVENTIYELVAFGALHRIGQPGTSRKPDTRALKPTTLGRSWLERELHPLPYDPREDP